ncbi:MAG: FKBP-type peptidyl-prolyl cis-trans isomerase [Candidatus Nanopelagicales bacterium]
MTSLQRPSRRPRLAVAAIAALSASLVLGACADQGNKSQNASNPSATSSSAPAPSGSTSFGSDPSGVEVTGGFGEKPTITIGDQTKDVTELQVIDLQEGTGPAVEPGALVLADYAGYGAITKKQFDSSFDRGQPAQFSLDGVIVGWTEGLVGMKKGGRRLLVIPADKAYGANPPSADIEPNEVLVFVVDLVDFLNPGQTPTPAAS